MNFARGISFLSPVAFVAAFAFPTEALAQRTYAATGPRSVEVKTLDASTSLVVPTTGGPHPLVVASHGFSASGENQLGWAKHFASWGFAVAVPSFPSPLSPNTTTNAGIIVDLVTKLRGPLASANKISTGAFGLEGHSAGGLATTVAASKSSPAAVVLFDPVDRDAVGKAAYGSLCAPVLGIFAGASSCNNNSDWKAFAGTSKGDRITFDVKGSTHCDGENAPRALCGTFCGGAATAERQGVYAHYATAFFLSRIQGDAAATTAIAAAATSSDSDVDAVARALSTCAAPTDAGASSSGASGSSSGTSGGTSGATSGGTGGATSGSSPSDDPAAAPGSSGESGCNVASPNRSLSTFLGAASIAAASALFRRRRSSRRRSG